MCVFASDCYFRIDSSNFLDLTIETFNRKTMAHIKLSDPDGTWTCNVKMPHLSWNLKVLTLDIKFLFYMVVFIFLDVFVLNSIGNYFLNERGSLFALEREEV